MQHWRIFLSVAVLALLPACKTADRDVAAKAEIVSTDPIVVGSIAGKRSFTVDAGVERWYAERSAPLPTGDRPVFCHGYGCELQTPIPITEGDAAQLRTIMNAHSATPADERVGINLADQWWEKHAAPLLGGPPRVRGSALGKAHKRGQTDCIDEATNTTTILLYLERKGMLRHHHVRRPEARGMFLYSHATAVMRDITTGVDWIADAWMRDSGDPIDVMTLEEWFSRAYIDPTE